MMEKCKCFEKNYYTFSHKLLRKKIEKTLSSALSFQVRVFFFFLGRKVRKSGVYYKV